MKSQVILLALLLAGLMVLSQILHSYGYPKLSFVLFGGALATAVVLGTVLE